MNVVICDDRDGNETLARRMRDRLVEAPGIGSVTLDLSRGPVQGMRSRGKLPMQRPIILWLIGPNRRADRFACHDARESDLLDTIATGPEHDPQMIPVLVDGARLPRPDGFPPWLPPLELRTARFDDDMTVLARRVLATARGDLAEPPPLPRAAAATISMVGPVPLGLFGLVVIALTVLFVGYSALLKPPTPVPAFQPGPPPPSPAGTRGFGPPGAKHEADVSILPAFTPWPPPTPSEWIVLPDPPFRMGDNSPTLGRVARVIVSALDAARYSERSYYAVPDGFALVARLERIGVDGRPLPEDFRFIPPDAEQPFSIEAYIRSLFFAPEGYYRLIVFIVTDQGFIASGAPLDVSRAQRLLREGTNLLPREIATAPYSAQYAVTALIYEYRKGAGPSEVAVLIPGRLSALTNLERAGLRSLVDAR